MLKTLIKKEVIETILDLRFMIVTLLFVVLIPLGMYVSRKDYEQRLAEYQQERQMYRQQYDARTSLADLEAHGFRPPSILSVFALGLDPFLPDEVITSRLGFFRTKKESHINDPESLLFGKVDLLFNVAFVVSLAALIFTFNSVSGEKETGTLRLEIANSIPRGQILLAKIVGNYVVILIPFVISLLIAMIILDASPDISILSSQFWPVLIVIVLVTFLFLLAMVSLGVCISTLTHSSITSLVMMLFVWVLLVLAVPKVSPMIAKAIYPIESRNIVSLRGKTAREEITKEFNQKKLELIQKCRARFAKEEARAQYDKEVIPVDQECQRRIANEIRRIEENYINKRNIQASIAMNLSRISPVSCLTYLISGLSRTGITETDTFLKNAQKYQDEVERIIYDNWTYRTYFEKDLHHHSRSWRVVKGWDPRQVGVPDMKYQHTSMTKILENGWTDILLLFLFNILFFVAGFLMFRKYDVR